MKLQTRFLMVPATAALLLLALGGAATVALNNDQQAMMALRLQADAAESLLAVRAQAAGANAQVYRLLALTAAGPAAVVTAEQNRLGEQRTGLGKLIGELAASADGTQTKVAAELQASADRAFKAADEAIAAGADLSVRNKAVQGAEQAFNEIARQTQAAVAGAREAEQQTFHAAQSVGVRLQWAVWLLSGLAVLLTIGLSLLLTGRVVRSVNAARDFAGRVAQGDLSGSLRRDTDGELGELQGALDEMLVSLRRVVAEVRRSSESISAASGEIASGNNDLSARTESQAGSLQETSSSMGQLNQTVRSNADSARQANQLALSASEVAERGGAVVNEVVRRMDSITESSRRIAEIIGVIDGIAFQTNILALNAAVEAARAGEQGRGFAVVAGEVRSLAQRSADAAREIKGLITASVNEVESGSQLVKSAGSTMVEIVSSVKRVADIIGEISAATSEQSGQIGQVNSAVGQLEQMTQQNAALVEESAAAAESLREQANSLGHAVAVFTLDAGSAAAREPQVLPARQPRHAPSAPPRAIAAPVAAPRLVLPAAAPVPAPRPRPAAALPAPSASAHSPATSVSGPMTVRPSAATAPAGAAIAQPGPSPAPQRSASASPRPAAAPRAAAAPAARPSEPTGSPSPRMPVNDDDWETF